MAQKFRIRDSAGKMAALPRAAIRPQLSTESEHTEYRGPTLEISPSDYPYSIRKRAHESGLRIQAPTGKVATPAKAPCMVTIIPSSPAEERAAKPKIEAAERALAADDRRWQRHPKHLVTATLPKDAEPIVERSDAEAERRFHQRITARDLDHYRLEIRRRVDVDRRTGWSGHTYGAGSMLCSPSRPIERVEIAGPEIPKDLMGPVKTGHDVMVEIWKDRNPARRRASEAEIKRWVYQEYKVDVRERTAHAVKDLARSGSRSFQLPETDRDHGRGWAAAINSHFRTLTDRQAFAAMLVYTEITNPAEDGWRRALSLAQRLAARTRAVEPTAVIRTRPKRSKLWKVVNRLRAGDEIGEDGRAMLAGYVLGESPRQLPGDRATQQYLKRELALGLADHLEEVIEAGRDLHRGWIEALEVAVGTIDGKRTGKRRSEPQIAEEIVWSPARVPPPLPLRPRTPSESNAEPQALSRGQVDRLVALWMLRQEYGGAIVSPERRARLNGRRKPSQLA